MLSRAIAERNERIEAALALGQNLAAQDPKQADGRAFLEKYFSRLLPEDVLPHAPTELAQAGLSLWAWGHDRAPGAPKLRVDAGNPRETVIEIVNDDMPFLVDSLSAALTQDGHELHSLIHPIIAVRRNARHERIGVTMGKTDADVLAESYMRIAIAPLADAQAADALEARLLGVLADVRQAVQDWRAMLAQVEHCVQDLKNNPPPVPSEEVAETLDLLGWMRDNHFTFLGYRDYDYGRGGEEALRIVADTGLGLLRDPARRLLRQAGTDLSAADMSPEAREFLMRPDLLLILKANVRSTVHRPVHLDIVAVKRFDAQGRAVGERRFVGLFTSTAYSAMPGRIPYLRRKVRRVVEKAGLSPVSHDGKALQNILDNYPRDELWQIDEADLYRIAIGILALQERPRTRLFIRRDKFQRFISALVFTPRERMSTDLRLAFGEILARAFQGRVAAHYTQMGDDPLARIHFIIAIQPGQVPDVDLDALDQELVQASRDWRDGLREALLQSFAPAHALGLFQRYGDGFPAGYRENHGGEDAASDVAQFERLAGEGRDPRSIAVTVTADGVNVDARLRLYRLREPAVLSDILPRLEHLGFRVIEERPYRVRRLAEHEPEFVWVQEFRIDTPFAEPTAAAARALDIEDAVRAVWSGAAESDGFNRLIAAAGLDWRHVALLRAIAKYLRQGGFSLSQEAMEDALARNPAIAQGLIGYFTARFDPDFVGPRDAAMDDQRRALLAQLDQVTSPDEDRVLRVYLDVMGAMLRTNFYQRADDGTPKPYVSFKINSKALGLLPQPRPHAEIFVYSPWMEGVHLRGGKVARGGIRWSDRREDFRAEILGLLKAQMVKNAVIVPVGAKGGFVQKRAPDPQQNREAWLNDGIACYKTLVRGMLDVTDNRAGGAVVAPSRVVRHDGDDPYLVVAADKGTATFSDIANGLAADYGFWLGDAFASGGSAGYDHKKMGITARGAWELVKRHFREMGKDIQSQDFTVAGVGDMSGDVFGNGMLLSKHIRLVAAFDHRHIFIDPNPDPAASWLERERLFNLPRSSWMDYEPSLISPGGGVYDRKAKSIALSPQARAALGFDQETATPAEVMQAILRAPVDLLWFGGIGTYVKSAMQSHADVHDRANDAIRVNGRALRAKVVGEGANLGVTQAGRMEYAQAGGRINTDAVDNSAGVDCSDHEVNIKILLRDMIDGGLLAADARNALLADMTNEVATLVLASNFAQGATLSLEGASDAGGIESAARFMRHLERAGRLDRALEGLPDDAALAEREARGAALTRPERAVLMAYAKSWVFDQILDCGALDDERFAQFQGYLEQYFPRMEGYGIDARWRACAHRHGLAREITATVLANAFVNLCGVTAYYDLIDATKAAPDQMLLAFHQALGPIAPLWAEVEALPLPIEAQYAALLKLRAALLQMTAWLLRNRAWLGDAARASSLMAAFGAAQRDIAQTSGVAQDLQTIAQGWTAMGFASRQAQALALMDYAASLMDCAALMVETGHAAAEVARAYYGLGERVGFAWLRSEGARLPVKTGWDRAARGALLDDLADQQKDWTRRILARPDRDVNNLPALTDLLGGDFRAGPLDLAHLMIAARALRAAT